MNPLPLVVPFLLINIYLPKWLMLTIAFALNSPWFCPSIFSQTHAHYPCVCLCSRRLSTWIIASMCNLPHHTHTQWQTHTPECYPSHTLIYLGWCVFEVCSVWPQIWAACLLKPHAFLLIHSTAISSSLKRNTQQKLIIKACCCTFTPYPHFWEKQKE